MSHEFKAGKQKGRAKYVGSWCETASKCIALAYTVESLKFLLRHGSNPDDLTFTHQDIAHWCDGFHLAMFDIDTDKAMDVATGIAADVDAQWDMYLANSYTLDDLKNLDFSKERMPLEWFEGWLKELENI